MKPEVMFKALGDRTRLEIIKMLKDKELCVCDILAAFSSSQPAISHHLKILKAAGLVTDAREGKWIYYTVNDDALSYLQGFLHEQVSTQSKKHQPPLSPNALVAE